MLCIELAWRFIIERKRPMILSLLGIVFGVSFFVITQSQTSGFEQFFIRTILGTNGAIRISDHFQDPLGTVQKSGKDGKVEFIFHSREDALYREGVNQPDLIRTALSDYPEISAVSEIIEGTGALHTGSRKNSSNKWYQVGRSSSVFRSE